MVAIIPVIWRLKLEGCHKSDTSMDSDMMRAYFKIFIDIYSISEATSFLISRGSLPYSSPHVELTPNPGHVSNQIFRPHKAEALPSWKTTHQKAQQFTHGPALPSAPLPKSTGAHNFPLQLPLHLLLRQAPLWPNFISNQEMQSEHLWPEEHKLGLPWNHIPLDAISFNLLLNMFLI